MSKTNDYDCLDGLLSVMIMQSFRYILLNFYNVFCERVLFLIISKYFIKLLK